MKMGQALDQYALESMLKGRTGQLVELYKNVRSAISESHRERRYSALWGRMAPGGNIYRHLAFRLEERRNTQDLNRQLVKLAEKHKALLGGNEVPVMARASRLFKLLGKVTQKGLPEVEDGVETCGFPPLEEFLDDPLAGETTSVWHSDCLLALLVCVVQLIAPILVVLHNWYKDSNQLRQPAELARALSLRELTCIGKNWAAGLTTIMGTIMLLVINSIILNYARCERENSMKTSRLPMDNFWDLCGCLTNAICCLVISLAIPLQLWDEEGPTGIIMDSMALLFVFSLDDLSSDAFSYLGQEEGFQRDISWYYALLSNCPVQLRDLINPAATSAEELWQITYDAAGRLQVATPPTRPCVTRISASASTEATPLVDGDNFLPDIHYQVHADGPFHFLPGWRFSIMLMVWTVVEFLLRVILVVVPAIWFVVNKPCQESVVRP